MVMRLAGQPTCSWPIVRHHEKRYGYNLWVFCSGSYSDKKVLYRWIGICRLHLYWDLAKFLGRNSFDVLLDRVSLLSGDTSQEVWLVSCISVLLANSRSCNYSRSGRLKDLKQRLLCKHYHTQSGLLQDPFRSHFPGLILKSQRTHFD